MQEAPNNIIIFLLAVVALILILIGFIISMVYLYRKKQLALKESLEEVKQNHNKNVLAAQLEMQEQTFQHISREIHDNISLSLTLAKLQLNTFDWNDRHTSTAKIRQSVELLGRSITELNQLSKGLDSDIIIQQGLLRAIDAEVNRIQQTGLFKLNYEVTGTPVYLDEQSELLVFRVIQESFNNIIKHAHASQVRLAIHFTDIRLAVTISDNGSGFDSDNKFLGKHAGLKNMNTRVKMLGGNMQVNSQPGQGTIINFSIPIIFYG